MMLKKVRFKEHGPPTNTLYAGSPSTQQQTDNELAVDRFASTVCVRLKRPPPFCSVKRTKRRSHSKIADTRPRFLTSGAVTGMAAPDVLSWPPLLSLELHVVNLPSQDFVYPSCSGNKRGHVKGLRNIVQCLVSTVAVRSKRSVRVKWC
ncbi:hypothetical protein F2P81_017019 [Scophthalmus maximus]|uniref:Uncharacterized protein n=1 Tax=Scophthalmus maximus TaxID=52904 RepID=A0A6A4SDE8_SCOMX|nr:hypothetical protein F2P81_017019 [Scophthalmus maximus]